MTKKKIGVVGVDSGQVLICDPCYIADEWDHMDDYVRDQKFEIHYNGRYSVFDMGEALETGICFDTPLFDFDGMTMNDLVQKGLATELPVTETGVFGYNGCCRATQSKDRGGQLNYKMGHAGAGVAVSTRYGDGEYPVYAWYDSSGRVMRIEVDFR